MHSLVELLPVLSDITPASFTICFLNTNILSFVLVSYEQREQAVSSKFSDIFSSSVIWTLSDFFFFYSFQLFLWQCFRPL